MKIQERILKEFKESRTSNDKNIKRNMSVIVGEMERQSSKLLSDEEVVKIVNTLIKEEKENLSREKKENSEYLILLNSYIPKQVSENEIIKWIDENIDFSRYRNKMQTIKPIKNHFGVSASGSIIKRLILQNYEIV